MAIQRCNSVSFKANGAAQVAKVSKTSIALEAVKDLVVKAAKPFKKVDSFEKVKRENGEIVEIRTYSGRPIFPTLKRQQQFIGDEKVFDETYGTHGADSRHAIKSLGNGNHSLVIDSDDFRIDAQMNSQKEIIDFTPIHYSEKGKAAIEEFEATQTFANAKRA